MQWHKKHSKKKKKKKLFPKQYYMRKYNRRNTQSWLNSTSRQQINDYKEKRLWLKKLFG